MWRAFALAIGVSALVLGVECLAVERVITHQQEQVKPQGIFDPAQYGFQQNRPKEYEIPEWAPWSLLSGGAIMLLYTLTTPTKS